MRRTILCVLTALAAALSVLGSAAAAHAADKIQPVIQLSADRTTLDPRHPTATVSGRVTDQSNGAPLPGVAVDLSANSGWGTVTDATTGADGTFTATFTPNGASDTVFVWANVYESAELNPAGSDSLTFQVQAGDSSVTVKADRVKLDLGQSVKVSGTVSRNGAGAANVLVRLWQESDYANCDVYDTSEFRVRTDGNGYYEKTWTPRCGVLRYRALAEGSDLYKDATAETGAIAVRQGTVISPAASIDKYGKVTVSAGFRGRYAAVYYSGKTALVQYSPNGTGGWKTVKKVRITSDNYLQAFIQYDKSGYWRIKFDGAANALPAISPVRKAWRWNTHFTGFKVSPKKVRFRSKITVSGTLNRYVRLGVKRGYAKQKVQIFFTCNSDKRETWYIDSGWATTDAKGRFKKRVRAYCTGKFFVIYHGGKDTFASGTNRIAVKVSGTPRRSATLSTATATGTPPFLSALLGATGANAARLG